MLMVADTGRRLSEPSRNAQPSNDVQTQQQHQQPQPQPLPAHKRHQELINKHRDEHQVAAPLASLDCSITEPVPVNFEVTTPAKWNPADATATCKTGSSSDTPTLSDYFDCDEYSDMVDDSLFEITNAGCLSKSVFGDRKSRCVVVVSGGRVVGRRDEEEPHYVERPDQESGQTTPTNEKPQPLVETIRSPIQLIRETKEEDPRGLVALMAQFQPYDYSSTSSVPRQGQLRAKATGKAKPQPPQPIAAATTTTTATHNDSGNLVTSGAPNYSPPASSGINHRSAGGSRRKSRSNPDVHEQRDETNSKFDLISGDDTQTSTTAPTSSKTNKRSQSKSSRARASSSSSSAAATTAASLGCPICREQQQSSRAKRTRRKKFTFSLFNLFTGNVGAPSGQLSDNDKIVCHHQIGGGGDDGSATTTTCTVSKSNQIESNSTPMKSNKQPSRRQQDSSSKKSSSKTSGRRGLAGKSSQQTTTTTTTVGASQLKLRDSIRVTNQRKQRTSSVNNVIVGRQKADELLLDLSRSNGQASRMIEAQDDNHADTNLSHQVRARASSAGHSRRPPDQPTTKSVKFTMPPDKVMSANLRLSGGSASGLPGAHLQPSAPIIKQRQVPKSSSYCQTDSNKTLDEMLARYEGNTLLIDEIIDKLKLSETIASNLSTLDGVVEADDASKCPCNRQVSTTSTSSGGGDNDDHNNNQVDVDQPGDPNDRQRGLNGGARQTQLLPM